MANNTSSRAKPAAEPKMASVKIKYVGPHDKRIIGAGDYGHVVIPESLQWVGKDDIVEVSLPENVITFLAAEPDFEIV